MARKKRTATFVYDHAAVLASKMYFRMGGAPLDICWVMGTLKSRVVALLIVVRWLGDCIFFSGSGQRGSGEELSGMWLVTVT